MQNPTLAKTADAQLTGLLLMVAFCITAPLLDASSKLATDEIPVGQIVTARFVFQGLCMLPVILAMRLDWRAAAPRSCALLLARRLPDPVDLLLCRRRAVHAHRRRLAIVFVMPFILMFLGKFIFGNPVGPRRIAASIVGFVGALFVIQPSLPAMAWWPCSRLGCALSFSFYEMATQAMSNRVHPVTMQLHTSIAGAAICLPLMWAFNGSGIAELDPVTPGCAELALAVRRRLLGRRQPPVHDRGDEIRPRRHPCAAALSGTADGGVSGLC